MTSQNKPSTAEPHQLAPGDDLVPASLHVQEHLPAIARVVVALAQQGNVSAASLCFRLGTPHLSYRGLLDRGFRRLSEEDLDDLALVLTDAGYLTADGLSLPTESPSCGTIPTER